MIEDKQDLVPEPESVVPVVQPEPEPISEPEPVETPEVLRARISEKDRYIVETRTDLNAAQRRIAELEAAQSRTIPVTHEPAIVQEDPTEAAITEFTETLREQEISEPIINAITKAVKTIAGAEAEKRVSPLAQQMEPLSREVAPAAITRDVNAVLSSDPNLAAMSQTVIDNISKVIPLNQWRGASAEERKNVILGEAKQAAYDAMVAKSAKPKTVDAPEVDAPGGIGGGGARTGSTAAREQAIAISADHFPGRDRKWHEENVDSVFKETGRYQ
jgi:hypothetical protein